MKNYIIILLCFCSNLSIAQDFPYWNKVSVEDLKMQTYEADTSAAAVYLLNYGKTRYDIYRNASVFLYDYHYQIKILKKSAFNEANIKFEYLKKYPIQNLKAVIHNWENGKRVTTEVTEIFDEKISKYRKGKNFSFPNVKVGSVIEYRFTYINRGIVNPRNFYYQKKFPVKFSEFHFAFPSRYSYQTIPPNLEKVFQRDTTYFIAPPNYKDIPITEYWWQYRNIPALPDEPFVNNVYNYRLHLTMQLSSYIDLYSGKERQFISSWEKLGTFYREDKDAGKLYNKSKNIKSLLPITDKIIAAETTEKDKMIALFHFVQNTIEWDEDYSIFTSHNFKKTIEYKSGNSADINLLLLTLLKHYGIEANPVLISTQDNDKLIITYPFLGQFNHVILEVMTDNKKHYIDAIDPKYPYNVLPQNSICTNGFLITEKSQEWIKVPQKYYEQITILNLKIVESNILANLNRKDRYYAANEVRVEIANEGEEKFKAAFFEDKITDYKFSSFEQSNLFENKEKSVVTKTTVEIIDVVQNNGDLLYFNPILNLGWNENPFQTENRNMPIELPYPISEQIITTIEIPEGYKVEELPQIANYKLPNNAGIAQFMAQQNGTNKVQVISKIKLNHQYFNPETYATVKEFFALIVESHSQQIVLKKIE